MKKRKKIQKSSERNSLLPAILFCSLVVVLIILSLVLRFLTLLKESKFTAQQQFNVGITRGKTITEVLSFDPAEASVSELIFTGKNIPSLPKFLGVHVDEMIVLNNDFLGDSSVESQLFSLTIHKATIKTDLSLVDLLRLYQFAKMTANGKEDKDTVTLPMDEVQMDAITQNYLIDSKIDQEKVSLGIENGTGISGLGSRIERAMLNLGCTVTEVTTSRTIQQHSRLFYYGEKTYTVKRLESIFHLHAEPLKDREASDILIIVGTDKVGSEFY